MLTQLNVGLWLTPVFRDFFFLNGLFVVAFKDNDPSRISPVS